MDGKPIHYDGSIPYQQSLDNYTIPTEQFVMTDEMRKNIAGNPYVLDQTE